MNNAQAKEFAICKSNIEYFIENYFVIENDNDYKNIDMTEPVKKIINCSEQYQKFYIKLPRRCGITTTLLAILLHKLVFDNYKRIKYVTPSPIMKLLCEKLFFSMEQLPIWMTAHIGKLSYNRVSKSISNDNQIQIFFSSSVNVDDYVGAKFHFIILDSISTNEGLDMYLNSNPSNVILNNLIFRGHLLTNFDKCC